MGTRLREERERNSLSLRALAERVGVSASLISQVETGRALPSVGTLYGLASALNVPMDELFRSAPPQLAHDTAGSRIVQRAGARKTMDLEGGVRWERLTAGDHTEADFLLITYQVGGSSGPSPMRHPGSEFGLLLRGSLRVTVGFHEYTLGPLDSIAFDSTTPHRLWNAGKEPAVGVWFVMERDRKGTGHGWMARSADPGRPGGGPGGRAR